MTCQLNSEWCPDGDCHRLGWGTSRHCGSHEGHQGPEVSCGRHWVDHFSFQWSHIEHNPSPESLKWTKPQHAPNKLQRPPTKMMHWKNLLPCLPGTNGTPPNLPDSQRFLGIDGFFWASPHYKKTTKKTRTKPLPKNPVTIKFITNHPDVTNKTWDCIYWLKEHLPLVVTDCISQAQCFFDHMRA